MKLLKRLVLVLFLLFVVVVGLVVFAIVRIDSIAKGAIEKGGTYALGVETKLDSASVGLLSGTFGLSGLSVANPVGFKSDKFFGLGNGGVAVSLQTLQEPVVTLPSLKLSDIRINLERRDGKSNYQVILDSLARLSGGGSAPGGEAKPKQQPSADEKRFVINDVEITNVVVHVDMLPVGGTLTQVDVPIDRISLRNVGTAGQGLPMGELVGVIVKALLQTASEKGGGLIPADLLNDLNGQLAKLGDLRSLGIEIESELGAKAKETLDKAASQVKEATDEAKKKADETLKDAQKKIGDLIPGKK